MLEEKHGNPAVDAALKAADAILGADLMEFNFNPDDRADIQLVDPKETTAFRKHQETRRALRAKEWDQIYPPTGQARKQLCGILSESYARYDYRHPAPSPKAELHGPEK